MKKLFILALLTLLPLPMVSAQTLDVRTIMREPSIAGMRVESQRLSPNGEFVIYAWSAEAREPKDLYFVSTKGGTPRLLVKAEENFEARTGAAESKLNYGLIVRDEFARAREKGLGGIDISPDSKRLLFSQNSDVYVIELGDAASKPRRIFRTQGAESGARWLGNDSILYSMSGNFFVITLKDASVVQVTREANPQSFISVSGVVTTQDSKLLAYVVSDGSKQRALFVPNYLDEFVQTPSSRRGFNDQKIYVSRLDGGQERPFEIKLPKSEGVGYIRGLDWAADNSSLLVDRIDQDLKRRQLFYITSAGSKDEKSILVTEEVDEKWVASLSRIVESNPKDPGVLFFGSERDGFNHLYVAKLNNDQFNISQVTKGQFEVDWAKWSPSGETIVLSSTEKGASERQFFELNLAVNERYPITSGQSGMKTGAQLEGDGMPVLLYEGSTWNKPGDLFAISVCTKCRAIFTPARLTDTVPANFSSMKWNAPKFIDIPSRDGKPIKSKIYLPEQFESEVASAKKRGGRKVFPMVIFVHGAGYLQNTINGWNNYYREFMFNQILTRKGYVVLDIDYRGSAGYGRDWRTDVHDFLGGKDYDDHVDAIDYVVKYFSVDGDRVGVYGGSYGGFMAGMLITRAPEKVAAAAALRPVFDWKNYFYSSPIYTVERLGFPEKNPEAYRRSSPISYAEQLKRPLLILHGLVDSNVPAQDSIQMIEKLMRLEKTKFFEAMLFPSEDHGFIRPSSWADEYERIEAFFDKHLK